MRYTISTSARAISSRSSSYRPIKALTTHRRIDVLVNNAGIFESHQGFLSISDEDWQRTLSTNFMSVVCLSRAILPVMVEQKSGVILNVASESARQPDINLIDYSVSKAALVMLSKALANEFGPQGIRVNTVSPGPTYTAQWDQPGGFADQLAQTYGLDKEAAIEYFVKNVRQLPTQRMGTPEGVAAVLVFLASDLARQITSSDYAVNGGSIRAA